MLTNTTLSRFIRDKDSFTRLKPIKNFDGVCKTEKSNWGRLSHPFENAQNFDGELMVAVHFGSSIL